jgi:hypothetical protein
MKKGTTVNEIYAALKNTKQQYDNIKDRVNNRR